jgi:YHS domain-containing protein
MIRRLIQFLVVILAIVFIRSVIGIIMKTMREMMGTSTTAETGKTPASATGGELKKDPVCGTFVPTATSLKTTAGGEVVYFCSPACRDKFRAS